MAGGKGSRLSPMKPVLEVCGKPMVLWVYEFSKQFSDKIFIATVKGHPTLSILENIFPMSSIIFTEGRGYEFDVIEAVKNVGFPSLVLPSDTPFIPKDAIEDLLNKCESSICTLLSKGEFIGISLWRSVDTSSFSSIETNHEIINVNTNKDLLKINKECTEGFI
ncbi:hypothetical protein HS5_12950 [Acidianus sp. HS-5]|nr:hypothetical protein HS5_12950 [Acidianus sp. HS-5]